MHSLLENTRRVFHQVTRPESLLFLVVCVDHGEENIGNIFLTVVVRSVPREFFILSSTFLIYLEQSIVFSEPLVWQSWKAFHLFVSLIPLLVIIIRRKELHIRKLWKNIPAFL
jgi:hypothetical protein